MKFTKEQQKIIDYMYKSLKASGYDDVSISGIIGNALTESSLNPDSVSESKTYHGLFQNDKNIRQAVINKYGDYSAKSQMKYAHDWVTGADWVKQNKYTVTNAGKFKRTGYKDAHEASDAWMRLYERPVIVDKAGNIIGYQGQDQRRANATAMYDYINTNYNNIRTTTTDKGKKITIPITAYQDPPQYESTYQLPKQTNTVYPLNPNDRTVPSLDAWNGVGSPSAGPNMPSLQKSMDERKRMFDLFSDNAIALGKKKTLPNLRNVLDRKMEDYIAGIMGVPDIYEEPGYTYTPMIYSPTPKFADGKSPIRIKPENRGKLTRLKKRIGKSESELYNDGNPAHKKMVMFARNARKWSHKR